MSQNPARAEAAKSSHGQGWEGDGKAMGWRGGLIRDFVELAYMTSPRQNPCPPRRTSDRGFTAAFPPPHSQNPPTTKQTAHITTHSHNADSAPPKTARIPPCQPRSSPRHYTLSSARIGKPRISTQTHNPATTPIQPKSNLTPTKSQSHNNPPGHLSRVRCGIVDYLLTLCFPSVSTQKSLKNPIPIETAMEFRLSAKVIIL